MVAEKVALCMRRANEVIATSDENLVVRVKEITNRKLAYAAVDPIGGEFTKDVAAAVRPGGTIYVSHTIACRAVLQVFTLGGALKGHLCPSQPGYNASFPASRHCLLLEQTDKQAWDLSQVYGALGGTTVTVGLGDLLFRGVNVTGFWCA